MPTCAAVYCKERPVLKYLRDQDENAIKITFHKFPQRDPELAQIWLHNIRREDFIPKKKSVICSKHFEEDYIYRLGSNVTLRKGAIPTLFDYPAELQDHIIYTKHELELEAPSSPSSDVSTIDHSYNITDMNSMKRKYEEDIRVLKKKLQVSQDKAKKYETKAHQLGHELKRLQDLKELPRSTKPTVKILSRSRQIVQVPEKFVNKKVSLK